jgi:hypothetical protein
MIEDAYMLKSVLFLSYRIKKLKFSSNCSHAVVFQTHPQGAR